MRDYIASGRLDKDIDFSVSVLHCSHFLGCAARFLRCAQCIEPSACCHSLLLPLPGALLPAVTLALGCLGVNFSHPPLLPQTDDKILAAVGK